MTKLQESELLKCKINKCEFYKIDVKSNNEEYKKAVKLMQDYVSRYYMLNLNYSVFCQCGLEIIEGCNDAINSYDSQKGEFFTYLDFIIRQRIKKSLNYAKLSEDRCGIKVPKRQQKLIKAILIFCKKNNLNINGNKTIQLLAEYLNISKNEIIDLLLLNNNINIQRGMQTNSDGEEINIIENTCDEKQCNPLLQMQDDEQFLSYIKIIEDEFNLIQNRQKLKECISLLLTTEIIKSNVSETIIQNIIKYNFFNVKYFANYKKSGTLFTQRQVGKFLGLKESDVSRKWHNFLNKLSVKFKTNFKG